MRDDVLNIKIKVDNSKILIINDTILNNELKILSEVKLLNAIEDEKHLIDDVILLMDNVEVISKCIIIYESDIILSFFDFNNIYSLNYNIVLSFDTLKKEYIIEDRDVLEKILVEYEPLIKNDNIFMYKIKKGISLCKKHGKYKFNYVVTNIYEKAFHVNIFFKLEQNNVNISVKDISKQEMLLNKITQKEKISLLSTLCDGLSHDFNNQLMILKCNIDYLLLKGENENLKIVKMSLDKLECYIKQLISFSKNNITMFNNILIDDIIDSIVKYSSLEFKKCNIIYNKFINDQFIYGNKSMLENAIYNIVKNAYESFKGKCNNVIIINLDKCYLKKAPKNSIFTKFKKGVYIKISIIDNSVGIKDKIINKIFDPFFSYNKKGHSGLGLSYTLGSLLQHDGIIEVSSKENIGTNFSIYLKVEDKMEQLEFNLDTVNKQKEVLIVDDEELICVILSQIITNLGYNVIKFNNGYDALNYYEKNFNNVGVVISDMMMPLLNGYDLFYKLKNINNDLKFYLLTAYSNKEFDKEFLDAISGFLTKPVSLNEVSKILTS